MTKHLVSFLLLFFFYPTVAQEQQQYILGAGDKIEIKVFGQADLSVTTLLGRSGKISYPFLGEIKIVGFSVKQVEQIIISGLKGDYLIHPDVSVQVLEYRDFYISGEVNNPGAYPYKPGLTINQAIAIAGGLTERASQDKIFLLKETDKKNNRKAQINDPINAGDTITIGQRFF